MNSIFQRGSVIHAPLGELCEIVGGGTPRRNNTEYFGGDIPWATPTDVTRLATQRISKTKECITETGLRNSSARLVPPGTVLMTSRATIGYTAIADVPMTTNQGFANFICSKTILPEYLSFWLRYRRDYLVQHAGGTTFKEISKSTLKRIMIPVPCRDEQKRVADILNRVAHIEALHLRAAEAASALSVSLMARLIGVAPRPHLGAPDAEAAGNE